jgi:hypothetical protein
MKRQEKGQEDGLPSKEAVLLVPGAQDRLEIENGSPIDGFERGDPEPRSPSISRTVTRWRPMGLGRSGDRVANTPASPRHRYGW